MDVKREDGGKRGDRATEGKLGFKTTTRPRKGVEI